jgi:uncharacterized protein YcbX
MAFMQLSRIYRYPVKGFTPEPLIRTRLVAGGGIPFDRACAFVCGNLPDPPVAGGWVPARTFYQLTVYPELAKYTAEFDDSEDRVLTVTAPDGAMARADLDMPQAFAGINRLIRERFEAGPHATPQLFVQAPGHGQWDFTDTAVSIINLASVRALSEAIGEKLDPLRFRANLYIDGIPAWREFALIGRRLKVGDAEIEVMRPAMRCAATSADPATGDTAINVPVALRRLTGHLFCGVYARVTQSGNIASASKIEDLGEWDGNPYDNLPVRTPEPNLWPRFVTVQRADDMMILENPSGNWPFLQGAPGQTLKGHLAAARPLSLSIQDASQRQFVVSGNPALTNASPGEQLVITGPFGDAG